MKIPTLSSGCYFCLFQHFQDGRRAQQHIENSWKQLETVSGPSSSDLFVHLSVRTAVKALLLLTQKLICLNLPHLLWEGEVT